VKRQREQKTPATSREGGEGSSFFCISPTSPYLYRLFIPGTRSTRAVVSRLRAAGHYFAGDARAGQYRGTSRIRHIVERDFLGVDFRREIGAPPHFPEWPPPSPPSPPPPPPPPVTGIEVSSSFQSLWFLALGAAKTVQPEKLCSTAARFAVGNPRCAGTHCSPQRSASDVPQAATRGRQARSAGRRQPNNASPVRHVTNRAKQRLDARHQRRDATRGEGKRVAGAKTTNESAGYAR